jgi:hypothetical protein
MQLSITTVYHGFLGLQFSIVRDRSIEVVQQSLETIFLDNTMKKLRNIFKNKAQAEDTNAHGPSFGVLLNELVERDRQYYNHPDLTIPVVFERLAEYMEAESRLKIEGLLRLAGSTKSVRELKESLDKSTLLK